MRETIRCLLNRRMKRTDRLREMRLALGDDALKSLLQPSIEKWGVDLALDRYGLPLIEGRAFLAGKPYVEPERITCGAKTRTGAPCKRRPIEGKRRCRNHGGLNSGKRTPQGRINAGIGLRAWHEARKNAKQSQQNEL